MIRKILVLLIVAFYYQTTFAQICNATNSQGCGKSTEGDIMFIGFRYDGQNDHFLKIPTCSGTPSQATTLNAGQPVAFVSGDQFLIRVRAMYSSGTFYTKVGVWLDTNFNDSFEASECIYNPQTGAYNSLKQAQVEKLITLPCFRRSGKCKMRFRGFSSSLTPTDAMGCGTVNTSGTIYDVEVDLKVPSKPSASFSFDKNVYSKKSAAFHADSANHFYQYTWKFPTGPTVYYNNFDAYAIWSAAGSYVVKLKTQHCQFSDSTIDTVRVVMPKNLPDGYFELSSNFTELYYNVQGFSARDSTSFSEEWTLTSPSNTTYTSGAQNPIFNVDEEGEWLMCHREENGLGTGNWYCRKLICHAPSDYYLGSNIQSDDWLDIGRLYDNGGTGFYGNNRKKTVDHFLVKVHDVALDLTIEALKLADTGDRLKIYIGEGDTGVAVHPSGGFRAGHTPAIPATFRSYKGAFFITFESDSSGRDSGFVISWKAIGNNKVQGYVYYDKDSNCIYDRAVDKGFSKLKINVGDNDFCTYTDTGFFKFKNDTIKRVIQPELPHGWKFVCPVTGKDTWDISNGPKPIMFSAVPNTFINYPDMRTTFSPSHGFQTVRGVASILVSQFSNVGNKNYDTVQCHIEASRKLSYLRRETGSYTGTDSTLDFVFIGLDLAEVKEENIEYKVKAGDTGNLIMTCSCLPLGKTDTDSSDNTTEVPLRIRNAFDPNDKRVSPESKLEFNEQTLNYVVRFQNTGTAPATTVIVRDTLSELLDLNSLQLLGTSHTCVMERTGKNVAFHFDNINLQDSNTNEPLSHGYLSYSVKPKTGLLPYQKIKNTAYIYFDAEAPVETNTTDNYWALKPTLTLNGKTHDTLDLCGNSYTDAGATAWDSLDGDLNSKIITSGNVNYGVAGTDTLWYSVTTSYNYTSKVFRIIHKMDRQKPHIQRDGKNITENMKVKIQVGSVFTDIVLVDDACLGSKKPLIVAGFNGPVNSLIRGNYPMIYYATDSFGNVAWEDGYTIIYTVEDLIPPVILLNTDDTVYHKLNTPYVSVAVSVTDNYFDSNEIVLIKSGTVNTTIPGLYSETFVATDPAGNSDTAVRYVAVIDSNAIAVHPVHSQTIKIWPNPADRTLHISNSEPISHISIYDFQGRILYLENIEQGRKEQDLDVSGLPQGMFILKVCAGSRCPESRMMIIAR